MSDPERLPTPHDTFRAEFVIPHSATFTNTGLANQLDKLYQVLERLVKTSIGEKDTEIVHPIFPMMINAATLLRQAKLTLEGQSPIQGVQVQPRLGDPRGGRA